MGFSIDILSHEEAMALPQSERPLNYRLPGNIYHAVFEAIGHASTLSHHSSSTFELMDKAEKCAVKLCFQIAAELEKLGITTEQIRNLSKQ